jgi:hypothetical protein
LDFTMPVFRPLCAVLLAALMFTSLARAADVTPEQEKFFEEKVRRCWRASASRAMAR